MITILGKLADTHMYINVSGCNVMVDSIDWTPQKNYAWLKEAVLRGDEFLLVSRNMNGYYGRELISLFFLIAQANFRNKIRIGWKEKYVTQG